MIEHVSIGVSDFERSTAFYDAVLAALGYVKLVTHVRAMTYGVPGAEHEAFAILKSGDEARAPGVGCHIAFRAPSRDAVACFHAEALRLGGVDEGAPGPRPDYGATYYAAFVRDPDGYRLEAVCLAAESP